MYFSYFLITLFPGVLLCKKSNTFSFFPCLPSVGWFVAFHFLTVFKSTWINIQYILYTICIWRKDKQAEERQLWHSTYQCQHPAKLGIANRFMRAIFLSGNREENTLFLLTEYFYYYYYTTTVAYTTSVQATYCCYHQCYWHHFNRATIAIMRWIAQLPVLPLLPLYSILCYICYINIMYDSGKKKEANP